MQMYQPAALPQVSRVARTYRDEHGRISIGPGPPPSTGVPSAVNGFKVDDHTPETLRQTHLRNIDPATETPDSEGLTEDPCHNDRQREGNKEASSDDSPPVSSADENGSSSADPSTPNSSIGGVNGWTVPSVAAEKDKLICQSIALGRSRLIGTGKQFDILYRTDAASESSFFVALKKQDKRFLQCQFAHYHDRWRFTVYRLKVHLANLKGELEIQDSAEHKILTFSSEIPPMIYKMLRQRAPNVPNLYPNHGGERNREQYSWVRLSGIPPSDDVRDINGDRPIELYQESALFEAGRCNTYQIVFRRDKDLDGSIGSIIKRLEANNVKCSLREVPVMANYISPPEYKAFWHRYHTTGSSLQFETRYLLDSALSSDCLDETEICEVVTAIKDLPCQAAHDLLLEIVFNGQRVGEARAHVERILARGRLYSKQAELIPQYCVKLRKVVITATTMRLMPPYCEMSNRILRQYADHNDRFLRVQFLDEIGQGNLRGGQAGENDDLFARVIRSLAWGVKVAGRLYNFLAFGNSQLREHGAFFFAECNGPQDCGNAKCRGLSSSKIREAIGDVSGIRIVAKQSSRIGQAFSTTRAMQQKQNNATFVNIPDYVGGVADKFCFSDGVGMISKDILEEVAKDMGAKGFVEKCPSAIQFRLGGAKGVLAMANPAGVKLPNGRLHVVRENQIFLRKSQKKFVSDHDSLEIVRIAKYGSAFLNRQSITTLWSLGVEPQVFLSLQRKMIEELDLSMTDENVALKCLRKYIDEHGSTVFLSELVSFGFMSRGDPFVQQVLRLFRDWSLKLLKEKAKVSVAKGCYLMGVVDETGTLKGHQDVMYDQDDSDIDRMDLPEIFIQIDDPDDPARKKVIEEICIVGRAPTLHPGDLRLVRAVDKPELRYLHDVIVFPASGDQDIPSQCSGGDLDGDDYTIIWDRSLFPKKGHRYERCMSYEGPIPITEDKILLQHIVDFMISFMKNDSLGTIALAHLAWCHEAKATMSGVLDRRDCRAFSDECMQLAELHSTAVDFAKTGVAAKMPPSLIRKEFPDFMEKTNKPSFTTDAPLSLMYRQVKSSIFKFMPTTKYDNTLCNVPGMLDWLDFARSLKQEYDREMQRLMKQYGIKNEAEIVTGFILEYSQQFSDKNEYKMRLDVANQYATIKDIYRGRVNKISDHDAAGDLLDRYTADSRKEAIVAAMYDVTFCDLVEDTPVEGEVPQNSRLSFPWIFHEILGRLSNHQSRRVHQSGQSGLAAGSDEAVMLCKH